MTWILNKLNIEGVKGALNRGGEFKLGHKKNLSKSIAIFGRNGHGKSGYADAVEYLFSEDGLVAHLGKGAEDSEQGGKHAIPHVLAKENDLPSTIFAEFLNIETNDVIAVEREVLTGRNDTRPEEISRILRNAPAHRVLRQHDLRRFVIDMKPGEKFVEFSKWVGLEKASTLLQHITTTQKTLKDTDVDREIKENISTINNITNLNLVSYQIDEILNWCEEEARKYLKEIDPVTDVMHLEKILTQLKKVRNEEIELKSKQVANLETAKNQIETISNDIFGDHGKVVSVYKSVDELQSAIGTNIESESIEKSEVFPVIDKAFKYLDKSKEKLCPVCMTPWALTQLGSLDSVLLSLHKRIKSFDNYTKHQQEMEKYSKLLISNIQQLDATLSKLSVPLSALNDKELDSEVKLLSDECTKLSRIRYKKKDEIEPVRLLIKKAGQIKNNITLKYLEDGGDSATNKGVDTKTSLNIDQTVSSISQVKNSLKRLDHLTKQEKSIRAVESEFGVLAANIRDEIKKLAEDAVTKLQDDVEVIYKKIHPEQAIPNIFIELDSDRKTLIIRVNFHSIDRKVPPGGYLSEAQINTLGFALFLSSVKLFNNTFPFIFLDDIVSSYDADNRLRIVDVISEYLPGFQVFLTTHDEVFYSSLRERLKDKGWIFERIIGYDFNSGPLREKDMLKEGDINQLVKTGNLSAGNSLRQYMEEWLDEMCAKYQANTVHKRKGQEYQRTLFDLWQPFINRVSKMGGKLSSQVLDSTFYDKLKGSGIINYYSHYQANPYTWTSPGDIKYVWEAFKGFVSLFDCYSCGKQLRYDTSTRKPFCICGDRIYHSE